ncbi:hypothetical protein EA462_11620 [Natrarchaeobius halalkaliphilus]|uniref:Uncharacterized protein n=1 Tax=Natrarchaeobius halalkaliphilus TaxID=1679091 RepID=A0A3N6LQ30_9EURY|nr:hypothetical protein EA462_11620 [Natrarchaeobius halalkaliphilus]
MYVHHKFAYSLGDPARRASVDVCTRSRDASRDDGKLFGFATGEGRFAAGKGYAASISTSG